MRTLVIGILAALTFATSSAAQTVNFPAMGIRLQEEMTENQVIQALGYSPNAVSLETCGSDTPHPWSCKVYKYGNVFSGELHVLFGKNASGIWTVSAWTTTP